MLTKETIQSQLQNILAGRPAVNPTILFTYYPAFNHIHEVLTGNEIINGYCIGELTKAGKQVKAGKWLLICTNQQFVLLHKGVLTGLTTIAISLNEVVTITPRYSWLSNKVRIIDKHTEWELYNVNKTDLQFFEQAVTTSLLAAKK